MSHDAGDRGEVRGRRHVLPLMFIFVPRFYGAWFHQLCVLTNMLDWRRW